MVGWFVANVSVQSFSCSNCSCNQYAEATADLWEPTDSLLALTVFSKWFQGKATNLPNFSNSCHWDCKTSKCWQYQELNQLISHFLSASAQLPLGRQELQLQFSSANWFSGCSNCYQRKLSRESDQWCIQLPIHLNAAKMHNAAHTIRTGNECKLKIVQLKADTSRSKVILKSAVCCQFD